MQKVESEAKSEGAKGDMRVVSIHSASTVMTTTCGMISNGLAESAKRSSKGQAAQGQEQHNI